MQVSEPTRATRHYLSIKAKRDEELRKFLKGISARKRREAIEKAAKGRDGK